MYFNNCTLHIIGSILATIFFLGVLLYFVYYFCKKEIKKSLGIIYIASFSLIFILNIGYTVFSFVDARPENRVLYYGSIRSPEYANTPSILGDGTQIMNDYWEDEDNVYVVYSKYLYKLLYVGKEPPYDGFVPSEQ